MRPTLRQLEYVVAVAREASFSKAAASCFVSQPSLSSQVRQLEVRLGADLFERTPRGVLITTLGHEVVELAQTILDDSDRILQVARASREQLAGALHLGSVSTITPYLLPGAMRDLADRFPELELHVHDGTADILKERLEAGAIDALLVPLPTALNNTEEVELANDPFVVAASVDSPIAELPEPLGLDALAGIDVLLLDDPHCLRGQALEICGRAQARPHPTFHATSLSTVVQLVRRGLGVTLLPAIAIEVELAGLSDIRLKRLAAPAPGRMLGLVWRKGSPRSGEFKMLASILMSHAENCARWDRFYEEAAPSPNETA
jgi:LysR family hydrogen peroxide-inducible transcriptional activator